LRSENNFVKPKYPTLLCEGLKGASVKGNNYNNDSENSDIYSNKIRAGKRTYFFDIKSTRSNDYYITITESKRRYHQDGEGFTYEKHKIFLYKEDVMKFIQGLQDTVDHMKTELMPDYDFNASSVPEEGGEGGEPGNRW
jgi:hypothetical protein